MSSAVSNSELKACTQQLLWQLNYLPSPFIRLFVSFIVFSFPGFTYLLALHQDWLCYILGQVPFLRTLTSALKLPSLKSISSTDMLCSRADTKPCLYHVSSSNSVLAEGTYEGSNKEAQLQSGAIAQCLRACSSHREPGFISNTQPSSTPVPRDPVPSSDLCRHQAPKWCMHIHAGKISINIKE